MILIILKPIILADVKGFKENLHINIICEDRRKRYEEHIPQVSSTRDHKSFQIYFLNYFKWFTK